jgi:hypothetical protein
VLVNSFFIICASGPDAVAAAAAQRETADLHIIAIGLEL